MAISPDRFTTRIATEDDLALVVTYIKRLAAYEKRPEAATVTEEDLREGLFRKKSAAVLLAYLDGEPVGYALFYTVFGSFTGVSRLHLEDLFVDQSQRGLGLGKELLRRVAFVAKNTSCAGLEWGCLDWNEPSIRFYEGLGAEVDRSHIGFTLSGAAMDKLLAGCTK